MKVYSKYDNFKSWSYPSHGHTFIPNFRLTLNLQNDLLLPMPFNSRNLTLVASIPREWVTPSRMTSWGGKKQATEEYLGGLKSWLFQSPFQFQSQSYSLIYGFTLFGPRFFDMIWWFI